MDFSRPFQLGLRWFEETIPRKSDSSRCDWIECDGRRVQIFYRRNAFAKRYRLFVDREGQPRVTIPRRGSQREAERFLDEHGDWLVQQLRRYQARQTQISGWRVGREVLFRGSLTRLESSGAESLAALRIGAEVIPLSAGDAGSGRDLRGIVERHLRKLATRELPRRVSELAALHQSPVRSITVRNQRTRWGSCSRRGTISLNWRLIQVPPEVRDYIILHELMHLREMNHSRRFWALVAQACPNFKAAESWLRSHSTLLQ